MCCYVGNVFEHVRVRQDKNSGHLCSKAKHQNKLISKLEKIGKRSYFKLSDISGEPPMSQGVW